MNRGIRTGALPPKNAKAQALRKKYGAGRAVQRAGGGVGSKQDVCDRNPESLSLRVNL